MRPIFPGRETSIAALFGLVHGLAFAATLGQLGLDPMERAAGTLAFNLGIEAMQLLVVAAVLPSLILLGRTRFYPVLRIGGALLAGTASIAWMLERRLAIETPVDAVANAIAAHASWIAVALFVLGLASTIRWPRLR